MSDSSLRYDLMVEEALRGVVRKALELAATRGLPGDHHFYITFRTEHPGVTLPASLRERYPSEMTIVLQYQFWGLEIDDEGFRVTLSFNDKPERLAIPFEAIKAFADPSVRFGLQFDSLDSDEDDEEGQAEKDGEPVTELTFDPDRQPKPAAGIGGPKDGEPESAEPTETPDDAAGDAEEDGAAKVVTLDTFRKK